MTPLSDAELAELDCSGSYQSDAATEIRALRRDLTAAREDAERLVSAIERCVPRFWLSKESVFGVALAHHAALVAGQPAASSDPPQAENLLRPNGGSPRSQSEGAAGLCPRTLKAVAERLRAETETLVAKDVAETRRTMLRAAKLVESMIGEPLPTEKP